MSPYQRVKWGERELPIPMWAVHALWITVLAGLLVWGYFYVSTHLNSDLAISPAEHMQLRLAQAHFGEQPAREGIVYSDDRGELRAMEFTSGDASLVRRVGSGPRQTCWLGDPSQLTPPPMAAQLPPDVTLAAVVYAGEQRCNGPWPHPDLAGEMSREKRDQCWIEVTFAFRDGCVTSQLWNSCFGAWEVDAYGNPVPHWKACAHS